MKYLFVLLFTPIILFAAPAPPIKPKSKITHPIVGHWNMTWCGVSYKDTRFNEDGSYSLGDSMIGHWKLSGTVLEVYEYNKSNTNTLRWFIFMSDGTSGIKAGDNSQFYLTPIINSK
jgi:hypothetical protein